MAHYEPPDQDLPCLQIQLFLSLVLRNKPKIQKRKQIPRLVQSDHGANSADPVQMPLNAASEQIPHFLLAGISIPKLQ